MNAPVTITAPIDAATLAIVEELARARGITGAEFAADAIRRMVKEDASFQAFVQQGVASIEREGCIGQDDMEAWFQDRVAARRP